MAGGLTPDERWAIIEAYGSESNAIDEALKRSPELQELWETQYTTAWWANTGDFWRVFGEHALRVLGLKAAAPVAVPAAEAEVGPDRPLKLWRSEKGDLA